jgi:hypothetical protein
MLAIVAARRFIAFSAEFPNDNAELHTGTIWMCVDLCGPAEAHYPEMTDAAGAGDADDDAFEPIEIVDTIELEGPVEVVPAPTEVSELFEAAPFAVDELPLPPPLPRIDAVTATLALGDAAPVSELEELFPPDTLAPEENPRPAPLVSTPPPAMESPYEVFLQTLSSVACEAGQTMAASEIGAALADDAVARAWRAILCGESEDFSLCGTPLDEWASATLARLLSAPQKAAQLRRELRARGVAAFGLIEIAA